MRAPKHSLRNSLATLLHGWLSASEPPSSAPNATHEREQIRIAMLALVEALPQPPARLLYQLQEARTLEALWDLRPEVMTALARNHGEDAARRQVQAISQQFLGLPKDD